MSVSGGHVNQTLSVFLKVVTWAQQNKKCPPKRTANVASITYWSSHYLWGHLDLGGKVNCLCFQPSLPQQRFELNWIGVDSAVHSSLMNDWERMKQEALINKHKSAALAAWTRARCYCAGNIRRRGPQSPKLSLSDWVNALYIITIRKRTSSEVLRAGETLHVSLMTARERGNMHFVTLTSTNILFFYFFYFPALSQGVPWMESVYFVTPSIQTHRTAEKTIRETHFLLLQIKNKQTKKPRTDSQNTALAKGC